MNDRTDDDTNGPDANGHDTNRPDNGDENDHIRALLAELGSGPDGRSMPPEVAARLDDTLARLVAERTGVRTPADADASGTVVPLQRRWLPRATAAAAAVIIVGAGGVAAANLGVFGNGSSMSSSDSGGSAGDSQVAESAPETTPSSPGGRALTEEDFGRETAGVALPQISAGSFASDVTSLLQRRAAAKAPGESPSTDSDAGSDSSEGATDSDAPEKTRQGPANALRFRSCPGPEIPEGVVPSPIRYDGKLAVLLVHPRTDGQQLVEAWACTGDRKLDSTTITP